MSEINSLDDLLITEDEFNKKMAYVVGPFLRINLKSGFFNSFDDTKIHYSYLKNPMEKGVVVISHGFCEFIGKYNEVMYYFYQMGFSVFILEHRGHGFSDRKCHDPEKIYVKDFDEYVKDFEIFVDKIVKPMASTKYFVLYGHSMGGAIATLYLERNQRFFQKAILSSPMHEMNFGKLPKPLVSLICLVTKLIKWDKKYAIKQKGYDGAFRFSTSSGESRARYKYVLELREQDRHYRTAGSTYGWASAAHKCAYEIKKNADKVETPILLFQAGNDTLVLPMAQEKFAKKSKNTKMVIFEDSKHEIYNSTDENRKEYYKRIFDFII